MQRHLFRPDSVIRVLAFIAVTLCAALPIFGSEPGSNRIIAVEEHWQLDLGKAGVERSAPQTTMVVAPSDNPDGLRFIFTLNHVTIPEYSPGGMQVQVWKDGQLLDSLVAFRDQLAYDDHVITWVQRVELDGDAIQFQVLSGESETWGQFGGEELSLAQSTSLQDLNSYQPGVSLDESQVAHLERRIPKLTLTQLVWYTADGRVHRRGAPIPPAMTLDPQ